MFNVQLKAELWCTYTRKRGRLLPHNRPNDKVKLLADIYSSIGQVASVIQGTLILIAGQFTR